MQNIQRKDIKKLKLLDQVKFFMREEGKSLATEKNYCQWIKKYIFFHNKKHPLKLGANDVRNFLIHLASVENVSPSTQNNALSAILFLYREVLQCEMSAFYKIKRPHVKTNIQEVLSPKTTIRIINSMDGIPQLMTRLIYGSGITLSECLRLRVKDLHFSSSQIFIRYLHEKGRYSLLPQKIHNDLKEHIKKLRNLYMKDLKNGYGKVRLHTQEDTKNPILTIDWGMQWLFPSPNISTDPRSGIRLRHHRHSGYLNKYIKKAVEETNTDRNVNIRSFQNAFAAHLLEIGYDIRTIQTLLGHKAVERTMQFDHLLNRLGLNIKSPLDVITQNSTQ